MVFPRERLIRMFLPRRSTERTFSPTISFLKSGKYFGSAIVSLFRLSVVFRSVQTAAIVRPTIVFRRPRVVVSTSGNSGMVQSYYHIMKKALFFYIFVLTLAFLPVHFSNAAEPTTPKVYPPSAAPEATRDRQVKILLVPGHDNEVWGAQYGNVKEARMNLAVGSRVYAILEKDKRFQVFITRDINGYTQNFAEYFTDK